MDICGNYGLIERRLRQSKGLTLDNVVANLEVSKTFLSYAENGKKVLTEEAFIQFLDSFHISFNFDLSLVNEIRGVLNDLVTALIYRNKKNENELMEFFIKNRGRYESSLGCVYLPLIELFSLFHNSLQLTNQEKERALIDAVSFWPLYTEDEKALLTFTVGYDLKKKARYKLAVKEYLKALEHYNGRQWPQLNGVIKMNLSNAVVLADSYFEAYEIVKDANDIFLKHSNYNRAFICQINIANCLLTMQCYDAAEKTINKVLITEESFLNLRVYNHAIRTMLLALTLEEKFIETIQFGEKHKLPFENGFIGNYCLIPYCYYRIGQPEESLREIKELSKEKPAADDKAFFSLLKAIIKKDKTGIEKEKLRMEKICSKQLNWLMLMVLYQLMIYYYTSEKEYELLADAYAKQAMVLKHKLPLPKE